MQTGQQQQLWLEGKPGMRQECALLIQYVGIAGVNPKSADRNARKVVLL